MTGVLHIVATPIGNLEDISPRAAAVLRGAALIAAEDTRHSRQLLDHLGISTPMISCHQHNEQGRSAEIIAALESGADVALISDAGTPLISDPGYRIVRAVRQRGIRVSPVPGPSSLIAALSAAGLPTDRFYFRGFLSSRDAEAGRQLEEMRELEATLVLFEAGRRIERLLQCINEVFPERPCVVAKELTKLHERFLEGRAADLLPLFAADEQLRKGEFVVLIDNNRGSAADAAKNTDSALLEALLDELPLKQAVRLAVRISGGNRNEIYRCALKLRAPDEK